MKKWEKIAISEMFKDFEITYIEIYIDQINLILKIYDIEIGFIIENDNKLGLCETCEKEKPIYLIDLTDSKFNNNLILCKECFLKLIKTK